MNDENSTQSLTRKSKKPLQAQVARLCVKLVDLFFVRFGDRHRRRSYGHDLSLVASRQQGRRSVG